MNFYKIFVKNFRERKGGRCLRMRRGFIGNCDELKQNQWIGYRFGIRYLDFGRYRDLFFLRFG